eukprot:5806239-Pleurochrysis_carterae.AAC.1
MEDQWRGGQPSARAKERVTALRTASRARVLLEITDTRRTSTALRWFERFVESTERLAFVDP